MAALAGPLGHLLVLDAAGRLRPVQRARLDPAAVAPVGPLAFGLMALSIFGFNFSAAVMLRRYGLLGPVILRVGSYMVWHVFYGTLFL